jgi:aminoglycoside phosphotransferase family enzyme
MMESAAWYQALQDPASYPEPTTAVEVRETHISWVFLTDGYAYKIKKPVNRGSWIFRRWPSAVSTASKSSPSTVA